MSSVARGARQRMEQNDVGREEKGRTGNGNKGVNSATATVTGAGAAGRPEHGHEGDTVAGVGGKGATAGEAA